MIIDKIGNIFEDRRKNDKKVVKDRRKEENKIKGEEKTSKGNKK